MSCKRCTYDTTSRQCATGESGPRRMCAERSCLPAQIQYSCHEPMIDITETATVSLAQYWECSHCYKHSLQLSYITQSARFRVGTSHWQALATPRELFTHTRTHTHWRTHTHAHIRTHARLILHCSAYVTVTNTRTIATIWRALRTADTEKSTLTPSEQ